ncbi:EamA family transporter RarD [Galbitalea soli]|uniref:EamA family transporter RarD n=1 Tax=Galbitalea soli TaxID=1268042 RepID=A0A7C9PN07_9MICO|nr:EamA family transporter RarD [Galbitalea soli]
MPVRGTGTGILLAVVAYGLWGVLPLFFLLLAPAGAVEVVAWRIVLSLLFCAVLVTVTRSWPRLLELLRDRGVMLTLGIAGLLILVNWLVYVFATLSGQVVEAALGYFTNPIVTVLLGVFVLRERLRIAQWVAIGISAVAVIVLAVNYGRVPIIALALAFSFGLYGLIKKRVGARVDALSGLTIETLWLSPLAGGALIAIAATSGLTTGTAGLTQTLAMLSAGVVTAVPLLLFAGAARRLPLAYLGLSQYLAPIMQFLIGVAVLHEAMPPARWAGFALVWIALIVLTIDMFAASRAAAGDARGRATGDAVGPV